MKIQTLRRQIDQLDRQLLKLLNQRARLSARVGRWKLSHGQGVFAPEREEQVLRRLEKLNRGPLEKTELRAIYREIMGSSRARQQKLVIGCLETGRSQARQVALLRFGASSEFQFFSSLTRALKCLADGAIDVATIPRAVYLRHLLARASSGAAPFFVNGDYAVAGRPGTSSVARDFYFFLRREPAADCEQAKTAFLIECIPGFKGVEEIAVLFSMHKKAILGIEPIPLDPVRRRACFQVELTGTWKREQLAQWLRPVGARVKNWRFIGSYPEASS
jgi:chorismate mutase-like protein